MRSVPASRVELNAVRTLGLDADAVDLSAVEAVANALRRAAAFLCPSSAETLVRAVLDPLRGLHDTDNMRSRVEETLEGLVSHGDLLELREVTHDEVAGILLHAAPPTFLRRQSGAVLVLGIAPDGLSPLTEELEQTVEYVNHLRVIPPHLVSDAAERLLDLGFIELSLQAWMKAPSQEEADEHVARARRRLDAASESGEIPGLTVLDPKRPVRYYRGRWADPKQETGTFLARRPQAYGADLWCFVALENGYPIRFIDLPFRDTDYRGCDAAWRLQAAIDYERGVPQVFRRRPASRGHKVFDFFSPVPMWARRRWNAFGEPTVPSGSLFSYSFPEVEAEEEVVFMRKYLWLMEDR